jgi:hypothetical protein
MYLTMDVNTVQERTRYFIHVPLYLRRSTIAVVVGVVVIAAGAGVHGSDKHNGTRELYVVFCPTDSDMSVFQWLTQGFYHGAVGFG